MMTRRRFNFPVVLALAVMMLALGMTSQLHAQQGGVYIDATGVLHMKFVRVSDGEIKRRAAAAKAALPRDLARPSEIRYVSLNRLEAEIARRIESGAGITDEMKNLAGLTRIRNVFYFPETKDIVVAGPAEGYMPDATGRMVGTTSGRSTLQLEDMIVALRSFGPGGKRSSVISVSIDPTKEGLAKMQQYLMRVGGRATPRDTAALVNGLRQSLGLQTVTLRGVSTKSHFAQVLVEADYRMKLIGIGLEKPKAKLTSYVERAKPASVARNALQRWYFVPNYECVRVTEDELAMELVGDGVKLIGRNELVTSTGGRVTSKYVDRASEAYVNGFTRAYPELAAKTPIFAQLRNLIDMSIAAAYIQDRDLYSKAGWEMKVFSDESALSVETYTEPKQVETAVNAIWRGNMLMTPIGGGVRIEARKALERDKLLADEKGKLAEAWEKTDLGGLAPDQWWWD